MDSREDKWVEVDVPGRIAGGLERIADVSGWTVRTRDGVAKVCLTERYLNTAPQLLSPPRLLASGSKPEEGHYARVASWTPLTPAPDLWAMAQESARNANESGRAEAQIAAFRLEIGTAPDDEVHHYLRDAFHGIAATYPDATLWAVEASPYLRSRLTASRVLFGIAETPEMRDRATFEGFPAARAFLNTSVIGHRPFVEPPLLWHAPFVHGFAASRPGGALVVLLGHPVAGFEQRLLLDVFRPDVLTTTSRSDLVVPRAPEVPPAAAEHMLRWWVGGMNRLLSVLLDPARYRQPDGTHDPRTHFASVLSFERFFAVLQGILVYSRRDEFVRKSLMFDALDLLEGLGLGNYRKAVHPRRVSEQLAALKSALPADLASLLLPRCEAAVDALNSTKDGFFLSERRAGDQMRVRRKDRSWEQVPEDTALADYLWVVRNSTHSFGGIALDPREISLLAAHTGDLPPALADLPLLHSLRLLLQPDIIRT